jgi:hypothetical protein
LDLGLSHRASVLVIYSVCVLLALLSLGLSGTGQMYAFMGLVMVFGLALLLIERLGDTGSPKVPSPPEPVVEQATDRPVEP